MHKHYNIRVTGKVQGVFYRASTQAEAIKLKIKGFVRNEANNDVYIEAEGTDKQLEKFINWLWKGPDKAIVKNVEVTQGESENHTDFIIKI